MRLRSRVAIAAILATAAIGSTRVPPAAADFTPFALISGSSTVEADYASAPAISADGQYVVYAGSQVGVAGLYRKNLTTGELDQVAAGAAGTLGAPSVSANGRYVSFTTTETDPGAGTGAQCSTVYRADLSDPGAPTYTVVSAPSGGAASLTYAGSAIAGCPGGGASAAGRVAISADGSEVAFTVVGASDLTTGVAADTTTPGAQVAVRDLDTQTTTLVSQTLGSVGSTPAPVPDGAAMTDNSTGVSSTAGTLNADPGDSTAAISADGSTVAWLGINLPAQVVAGAQDAAGGYPQEYDEPLWRRIGDGPTAPIRRVIGGDDPACGCSGPLDTQWEGESPPSPNTGPERGSFIAYDGFSGATALSASTLADATPQLSATGQTVAILSTQPATGEDPECSTTCSQSVAANAYVVDMATGLNRSQALTPLTEWASDNFTDYSSAGPIAGIALSPEGDRVAFVTRRTQFPFSPPALITPGLTQAATQQLYVADVAAGTMELVSTGYDGQPANGDVVSPSFSADDGPIVFASSAHNLVYGAYSDTGPSGDETFVTTEVQPPEVAGTEAVSSAPPNPTVATEWVISTTIRRARDGSVVLDVAVPGAGRLSCAARAAVSSPAARGLRSRRSGGRSRTRRRPVRVTTRTLARARTRSRQTGLVSVRLRPAVRYRPLIAKLHGLYAAVTVSFAAGGHRTLREKLPVEFVAGVKRKLSHLKARRR